VASWPTQGGEVVKELSRSVTGNRPAIDIWDRSAAGVHHCTEAVIAGLEDAARVLRAAGRLNSRLTSPALLATRRRLVLTPSGV
jgi:hypothetical protein